MCSGVLFAIARMRPDRARQTLALSQLTVNNAVAAICPLHDAGADCAAHCILCQLLATTAERQESRTYMLEQHSADNLSPRMIVETPLKPVPTALHCSLWVRRRI